MVCGVTIFVVKIYRHNELLLKNRTLKPLKKIVKLILFPNANAHFDYI